MRKRSLYVGAALLALGFGLGACKKAPQAAVPVTGDAAGVVARSWKVNAELLGFKSENKIAILKHEAIPDFMEAMTMGFELKSPDLAKGLKPKDQVVFTLQEMGGNQFIVTDLKKRK